MGEPYSFPQSYVSFPGVRGGLLRDNAKIELSVWKISKHLQDETLTIVFII